MNKITYIMLEEGSNNRVRYMAVGEVVNEKFNGLIYSYVGGGEYDEWYVYQDRYLPTEIDCHPTDYDVVVAWFENLCPNLKNLSDEIFKGKYTEYKNSDGILYFKPLASNFGKGVCWDGRVFSKGSFIPISFGNTEFPKKEEWWSIEELREAIDWKRIVKEEFDRQQVISDVVLSSNDLLVETINSLKEDLAWSLLIDITSAINYLETIVQEIEFCGSNVYSIDIRECDICTSCGKVLLPVDELYEAHNGDSLCSACAVHCEDCGKYYPLNEMIEVDGVEVCPNCAKKQKFEVQAKRTEYLKTEIYANSYEEALKMAEEHFGSFSWKEIDGTLETKIVKDKS